MGCSISSRLKSCVSIPNSEELSTRNGRSYCNNTEKNLKEIHFIEDIGNSNSYNAKGGFLSSECVHMLVDREALPICETSRTLEHVFDYNQEDNVEAPYFSTCASINLNKHSSELLQLHSLSDTEDVVKYDEKSEERFSSFLTPLISTKRIPALKGCHSQTKNPMSAKLTVKWAPEVYDPPATSLSHTVKGHRSKQHHHSYKHHTYHHRPKPKMHYHSNKHNKEKSKKHAHRSSRHGSSKNTRTSRLQALKSNKPVSKSALSQSQKLQLV